MTASSTNVAIACQGGGSHTAFTSGVLIELLENFPSAYNLVGMSGTSGGAACATLAWYGLMHPEKAPRELLAGFWDDLAADSAIDRTANTLVQWGVQLQHAGFPVPDVSPKYSPGADWGKRELRRLLKRYIDFEQVPQLISADSPVLFLSAIDVLSGEFTIFHEDELTVEHILASAAEPHLFEPVEIDGRHYWDGLFSKNPPIEDFMRDSSIPDPEEIWIIKINPQERLEVPETTEGINDRRNELSGNLSMNAEVRFIERVNDWIEQGYLPDRYTKTEIKRIAFPRAKNLNWRTKLDRDPEFLEETIQKGKTSGQDFLATL